MAIFLAFLHLAHCLGSPASLHPNVGSTQRGSLRAGWSPGWTYMQIGHQLQETRAIFAAGCVVISMLLPWTGLVRVSSYCRIAPRMRSVLQQIIFTLDIMPTGDFPIQWGAGGSLQTLQRTVALCSEP